MQPPGMIWIGFVRRLAVGLIVAPKHQNVDAGLFCLVVLFPLVGVSSRPVISNFVWVLLQTVRLRSEQQYDRRRTDAC